MRRWLLLMLALVGGFLLNLALERHSHVAPEEHRTANFEVNAAETPTLDDLATGKLKIVDLAWPLNHQSNYWPGENYKPFDLQTIATLEKDGVLSKSFASPEHLGTHLDAPNHFERERPSVDQIEPAQLFAPGVVIDVAAMATANPDYRITLDAVRRFEAEHGRIPEGAVVLANTGWARFWNVPERYRNRDVMSRLHFPGFSPEAVDFLIRERKIRGVGLDTMSVDYGLSTDFAVHHQLGKASLYGLENLAHLDDLPARGFYLVVAPMKIETGSGGPARVFAVLPGTATGN